MEDTGKLVDMIYEAAFSIDAWPLVLSQIAAHTGAKGGLLFASNMDGVRWVATPGTAALYQEFIRQGWTSQNERVPRLIKRGHAGFLTDSDLYTETEIANLPMYTQYLTPLGYDAGAATAIPGLAEDELILSMEGFAGGRAAHEALPALDALRPHLARASMLAARFKLERAHTAVAALELVGVPGAVLGTGRRLLSANSLFNARLVDFGHDTPRGLALLDARVDARLAFALTSLRAGGGQGVSLPLRQAANTARAVLHVIPLRGTARDLFSGATAILTVAETGKRPAPSADIIQALLDLTPAEARLARALVAGTTLADAASDLAIATATARSQLKNIFSKTGLSRQNDLLALLGNLAHPSG